jgi:transposase-like protein
MTKIKSKTVSGQSAEFKYEEFESEAIEGLKAGRGLVGAEGVLTSLIQRLVNAALSGEMNGHLKEERSEGLVNRRNGHTSKTLDTELGPVGISPPRDRAGRFDPVLVGKWDRQLGTGLDRQILTMYAHGNSHGDIHKQLKELYGLDYSPASITEVTDQVWGEVSAWQQRPLFSFYVAVFLDGIHFTTREGGKAVKKVVYSVYGVDAEGRRDVLGIYVRDAEGASE